jgi:carbon-monoxide dehydrogenase medium subunit
MIPSAFEYSRAASVSDALAKLRAANGDAKLIAGGHSLIPVMKFRLSEPKLLIDIGRIPELSGIRQKDSGIEIGAGTVHHDVATSGVLRQTCPLIAETAGSIGDPQVRNRGTIGGSLAHADPSADYPAAMLALDADIHLRGLNGPRVVKASDFFRGLFTVDLAADEIIVAVQFKPVRSAAYAKLYQRASHFAIVGVAAALDVNNGTITSARIGVTGAGSHATRLTRVEDALAGKQATADSISAAIANAGGGMEDLNADLHASSDYRRAMVPVFTGRALTAALARVGQG